MYYTGANKPGNSATWSFSGLASGIYRVSTTWVAGSTRASNAPYTLTAAGISGGSTTVVVNQRVAPASFGEGGAMWGDLGTFTITGGAISVQVTGAANGYVIADAVRVERLSPLLVGAEAGAASGQVRMIEAVPAEAISQAIASWAAADADAASGLRDVRVLVDDLPDGVLGLASWATSTIWVDADAAGYGWRLDTGDLARGSVRASFPNPGMDLLTVLAHEFGHVLGLPDVDPDTHSEALMSATLPAGVRRLTVPASDGIGNLLNPGGLWSGSEGMPREADSSWLSAFGALGGAWDKNPTAADRGSFGLLRRDRELTDGALRELSDAALLAWADDDKQDDEAQVLIGLRRDDDEHSTRVDSVFEAADDWGLAPFARQTEDRPHHAGKR